MDTGSPPNPVTDPDPVTLSFVWNAQLQAVAFHWTASTAANLLRYQLRVSAGSTYNAAAATVVDNIPPGTLTLSTIAGLPNVGSVASYKLFVILTTGNEAGSNTVTVTRPAP